MFPPKRRLLTREEFEEQARIETAKALKDLQSFVQSPKCNQWKTVMNLSQPTKFASFVQNGSHVTLDETRLHEETINDFSDDDCTGSESDDSFVDESVHIDQSVNLINKSKLRALSSYDLQKSAIRNNASKRTLQTSTPNSKTPVTNGTMNGRSSTSRQRQVRESSRMNKTYEISDDDE
jgi:NEMP family